MAKPRFSKRFVFVVAVFVSVFFLNRTFNGSIQGAIYKVVEKPGGFIQSWLIKFGQYSKGVININTLIKENTELRGQHKDLLSCNADIDDAKRENALLRNQLNSGSRSKPDLIVAHLFDRQRNHVTSTILIDKGEQDGVRKSMAVIASGNLLMGVVDEVFDHSSRVVLVDDPHSRISVRIQGTETIGDMRNSPDATSGASIDLITSKDEIKEGDIVVTSGLDGLPQSLLVGTVQSVALTGGNLFKSVSAKLFGNELTNPLVFVIKP